MTSSPAPEPVPDEVRKLADDIASGWEHRLLSMENVRALANDIEAAIMADRARRTDNGVRVRELEWRDEGNEDDVWATVALGLGCRYETFPFASDAATKGIQVARLVPEEQCDHLDILGYGKTLDDAKAIAQADHAHRLSALTPAPAAPDLLKEVAEALRDIDPLLVQAGNVAYNMKQSTSPVESARQFERINGWVDDAKKRSRAVLAKLEAATPVPAPAAESEKLP